jgi:putative transcriptional regulator
MKKLVSPLKKLRSSVCTIHRVEWLESRLSSLRRLRNLTQQDLADALRVSLNTVDDWENGLVEADLTVTQTIRLFKVLGVTLDDFLDDFPDDYRVEELESPLMRKRIERRVSQQTLADALGVSRQTVSSWENGHSEPNLTLKQVKKLCELLGYTLDDLPDSFGPQPIHHTSPFATRSAPILED